jgi:hypothetical protein
MEVTIDISRFPKSISDELSELSQFELENMLLLGYKCICKSRIIKETPQSLGDIGEDYVEKILATQYNVSDVSRKPHSGDMIITRPNNLDGDNLVIYNSKMLVEVKNYTNTVPSREVDKFLEDLRTNKDIVGGLFISLNSDIVGVRSFEFQNVFLERHVPILYVSSNIESIILLAATILWEFIDNKFLENTENDKLSARIDEIYEKILKLSDVLENIKYSKIMLDKMRDTVNVSVNSVQNNLFLAEHSISEISNHIKKIIDRISEEKSTIEKCKNRIRGECGKVIDSICFENHYPNTNICKFSSVVKKISSMIFLEGTITILLSDNITMWREISGKQRCMMKITPLKTKTRIGIRIRSDGDKVNVPKYLEYNTGYVYFVLDKTFISKYLVKLENYLSEIIVSNVII